MKIIEVDDDLYRYIASQSKIIGESASDILRRLLISSLISIEEKAKTSVIKQSKVVQTRTSLMPKSHNGMKPQSKTSIEPVLVMQTMFNSKQFREEKHSVGRFMMLLSSLYRIDNSAFACGSELKGSKRVYLAKDEETLLANGQATRPKQIPHSPYWVITNTNTQRKQQIIQQIMEKMGFESEFITLVINTI